MADADSLSSFREKLPVFKCKEEILETVNRSKTVIFVGETASGKSTQIPQYLLERRLNRNKCIAITQPRRVAAITIAEKVAEEVKTELGGKVGYSVRFENVTSTATKIKYLTDGMLLREALRNPLLPQYSIVMLDEAHERTLSNDILFGIVKRAQRLRVENNKLLPLKVIISSATLDYNHLSKYFDDAPVYFISGRGYNIKICHAKSEQEDYVRAALVTVFQIHQGEEDGDILVFCTGQEEIDSLVSEVHKTAKTLPVGYKKIFACGLYGALPSNKQTDILKPAPPNFRKVIFATNIAETSITIPRIKYVIDTGMIKTKSFNAACEFDILKVHRISKAQADQRAGRAGREFNGICYRLYTLDEFLKFEDYAVPDIMRCSLPNAVLQMVGMGIKNIKKFDFIDKPSDENIDLAVWQLKMLDAVIEDNEENLELTAKGKKMVRFPLDPRFSRIIISSKKYRCVDEILTIISLLSVESIFYSSTAQREMFAEARQKFESIDGDHIMLLNIYKAYKNMNGNLSWCRENFVNARNMRKVISIRTQLFELCRNLKIKPCSSTDTVSIRKCLATGLFMNCAVLHKNKVFKLIEGKQKVKIHPSSCLFKSLPSCVIYTELVQTSKTFMRNVSSISEENLVEVAPLYFKDKPIYSFKLHVVES